jgi:hypothetical protein
MSYDLLPARRLCLLAFVLLAVCRPAAGAPEGAPSLFPQDGRLSRTVSVHSGSYYLGELLETLARQAEVRLRTDETLGPVSGIVVIGSVADLPLREVMAGLTKLLTHRHNRWEWKPQAREREGYVLRCQRSPSDAATAAQKEVLQQWKGDLRSFHETARLPEADRLTRTLMHPSFFPNEAGNEQWNRINLVGELTAPDLDALLRGTEVPLERSRLSPRGQAAYDWAIAQEPLPQVVTRLPSGEVIPQPQPNTASVAFSVKWEPESVGPLLWCRVRRGHGAGSTGVFGGGLWDRGWFQRTEPGWQDLFDPEIQRLRKEAMAAGQRGPTGTPIEWIERAGKRHEFNILIDPVHPPYGRQVGTWIGSTLEQTIAMMLSERLYHRMDRLHLLRQVSASVHPRGHLMAWPRIKALRQAADRNGGYLGFDQLLQLGQCTPDQALGLVEEFPDAEPERLESWRPVLQFYLHLTPAAQAQARGPEGLMLRDAGLAARGFLDAGADKLNVRGLDRLTQHAQTAIVSLRVEARRKQEQEIRQLVWQVRVPGTQGHRAVFVQEPRRPPHREREEPGSAIKPESGR